MRKLQTIIEELLNEAGALKPIKLGPGSAKISVTPEVKDRLIKRLFVESKFNNRILIAVTILHIFIFIIALWLVYYNRNSLTAVSVIFGGSVLSLLGITRSLSNLWRTKTGIDLLIAILPSLCPEQVIQVIKDLYYNRSEPSAEVTAATEKSKL